MAERSVSWLSPLHVTPFPFLQNSVSSSLKGCLNDGVARELASHLRLKQKHPKKVANPKKARKGVKAAQNRARALKRTVPRTFPTCHKVRCWLYWSMKNSLPTTRCSKLQNSTVKRSSVP